MKITAIATLTFLFFSSNALAGDRLLIDPIEKVTSKPIAGIKKFDNVTVTGSLMVVAMQGAQLTLNSNKYGQIILFSPMDVDVHTERKLKEFEKSGALVKVIGTMNTLCSEKQLKIDMLRCRRFDFTKQIIIEKP